MGGWKDFREDGALGSRSDNMLGRVADMGVLSDDHIDRLDCDGVVHSRESQTSLEKSADS